MPIAHVNDIDIYYEVHGEGANLVLIEGLGTDLWMWFRQLPAFTPHFRTLVYDVRGIGRSDMPPGPYSHSQNAADLAGLLDHLGWERTHVLGISMGGFIAQQFALDYSARVDRLVLVSTAFGGPNMVPIPPEALRYLIGTPEMTPEQRIREGAAVVYGNPRWPEEHSEEFEQIVRWRLQRLQPDEARTAQAMAGVQFNVEERVGSITAPTLVIIGSEDRVVPPGNAEMLARAIPGARLDIIPGAGHHAWYEAADRFNADVLAFLKGETVGVNP
jgi:pimeloyl-ACP methyl ester carboxylesterase